MDDRVVGNTLHLQTKAVGTHTVMLQKSHFNKLPSISNCSIDNIIPMKCASQRYCYFKIELIFHVCIFISLQINEASGSI